MGLKGNLSSVGLAEVFQTLSNGSSTGLLRIQAPEGPRFVELQNGAISIAGRSAGRVMLGDLLISRGLIDDGRLDEALRLQKESGKMLGEVLIQSSAVTLDQLENALRFQIEEEVCELFTLKSGDFDFLDGAALDSRMAPAGGLVRLKLELPTLLAEAARRAEEWTAIEQRIPSQSLLFETTAAGDELLQGSEGLSPEGMILLRLAKTHRTVEAMVQKACLGRFTTNRMLLELWDAGIVEASALSSYERVAKEHLRLNRNEEAQRVAEFLIERGEGNAKAQGTALLQEIAKSRRPPVPSSSAYVSADPKVRSEVIRRSQPGLILKKEQSYMPVVSIALVVLLGVGIGTYYVFFRGQSNQAGTNRRQLEEVGDQASTLIAEGKYREGLQLLREFRSFDSTVRKQASELFEKRQRDVEANLKRAIETFDAAQKANSPAEIDKAVQALSPFIDISVIDPTVNTLFTRVRRELQNMRDRKRLGEFEAKFAAIESGAKSNGNDATLKACEALLAENPPEILAVRVRATVNMQRNVRAEAASLVDQARESRDLGDMETARLFYERARQRYVGSSLTQEADKAIEELVKINAAAQTQFDQLQLLIQKNKTAEAREGLLKYLAEKPPQHIAMRALLALQGLSSDSESELMGALKAANAQYEKQPEEARKAILSLVEKNPFSKTATMATLKIRVSSQPDGASVMLNGKPAGPTPLTLDVPAMGLTRLSIAKEGFRTEDVIRNNLREDSLNIALEMMTAATALMPIAADHGMVIASEKLVLSGAHEAVVCSTHDLQVNARIRLPGAATTKSGPPMAAFGADAFIPEPGANFMFRVNISSGDVQQIDLDQIATSTLLSFNTADSPPERFIALATQQGLETFYDAGVSQKRIHLGETDAVPPLGLATNGTFFFSPRPDKMLIAVEGVSGLKKWETNTGDEIAGPPAYHAGSRNVAVLSAKGRVATFDGLSGTPKWQQDLKADCAHGIQALDAGFLVVQADGKAQLLEGDSGKSLWSGQFPGKPVLAPYVIQAGGKKKAIACCTSLSQGTLNRNILTVISAETGLPLWRKTLDAPVVAMTASEKRLFVSTADATVLAFDLK